MGLFEQFPFTNFHELNLDFILRKLKKLEDRMAELDGKMAALEGKMDVLRDEMDGLREAMAALVQLVESFRDTLDGHTQELEALNARCDSLESELTALENSVSALAGRVTLAESGINDLTGRMTSAENGINALTGRVAITEVDIAALEGRMDSVESGISALRENITEIAADVTKLQSVSDFPGSDISNLVTLNNAFSTVYKNCYRQGNFAMMEFDLADWTGNAEGLEITLAPEIEPYIGQGGLYISKNLPWEAGTVDTTAIGQLFNIYERINTRDVKSASHSQTINILQPREKRNLERVLRIDSEWFKYAAEHLENRFFQLFIQYFIKVEV